MFINTLFNAAAICIAMAMAAGLYRAARGPSSLDHIIGVNAIGSKTTPLLIIIGVMYQRVDMLVDIALAYAMLNFIAVLAASRYFQKRRGLHEDAAPPSHNPDKG
ncbi:monovalent cation/H+ antiporter complex subunit F [Desulfobotulus sp. H1]|uniref:Monovalent cation/H+ antiporter complex subunit F n=1 Tax=Desulfobotulus pelophilus TaxID=2823377 RepID=A0ABT3NBD5_9BACT|nr:monovalent cation/H+ antiporter complex subunit F [Desulfobotulus pelophilus]MCW7754764.1 monovalent cation/H+ antiporter complex subunit F [Desulfobotulus pelophilus]